MEKKETLKNRIKELENNNIDFSVENPDSFISNTDYRDKNVFILFTSENLKVKNEIFPRISGTKISTRDTGNFRREIQH